MKPHRSKFVGDLMTMACGQVLSKVLGFLAFAYLARTLGATTYGSIEFAASLAMFFSMIIDCGLGAIGVCEVGKSPERIKELAAQIPAIRLLITVVVLPLMGCIAWAAGQGYETVIMTWMFGLSLIASPWIQPWLLQSRNRMIGVAMADVLQMAVLYGGVRLLVSSREDLLWIGGAQIASTMTVAAFYLWYQQSYITPIRISRSFREMGDLFQAGLSIGLSNIVWAFQQYSPIMLMIVIAGAEATGFFGVCHRLVVSLLTFSYVYHFNLFPEMARRAVKSTVALEIFLQSSFRVVAWIGCGLALMLAMTAGPILRMLYGESFTTAAPALTVLAWILPITILGGHVRWSLIAVGRQRYVLFSQIAGAIAMLLVGPILIIQYGAVGASSAMVFACLTVWLVAHFFAVRWVGHAPSLAIAMPPAGIAIAMLIVSEVMNVPIPLGLVSAAFVFVLIGPLIDSRLFTSLRFLIDSKGTEQAAL